MDLRYIREWREYKKPPMSYFRKVVGLPGHVIDFICERLGLDQAVYLSSGKYGDAYKVGDKVLKISLDKHEAKSVWKSIKSPLDGVIKYYSVNQFRYRDRMVYIIVMDYVIPLDKKLSGDQIDFCFDVCDIIYRNWGNLNRRFYDDMTSVLDNFDSVISDKLWDLYKSLSKLGKVDLHPYNLGVDKHENYVVFDYSDLSVRVNKFDQAKILESSSDVCYKKLTRSEAMDLYRKVITINSDLVDRLRKKLPDYISITKIDDPSISDSFKVKLIGERDEYIYDIIIYELPDEWYLVRDYSMNNLYDGSYYMCDQFDGLISCLIDECGIRGEVTKQIESKKFKFFEGSGNGSKLYRRLSDVDVDDVIFDNPISVDKNYLRSIGRTEFNDNEFQEIKKLVSNYDVYWIEDYRRYDGLPKSVIMCVEKLGYFAQPRHSFSIEKRIDEWYYLLDDDNGYYYKCDQFDGLVECIKEVIIHDINESLYSLSNVDAVNDKGRREDFNKKDKDLLKKYKFDIEEDYTGYDYGTSKDFKFIYIMKYNDDWYCYYDSVFNEYYLCDQLEGLESILIDKLNGL